MLKRIILPVVILALAIFSFIVLKQTKPESPIKTKPEKVWLVETTTVAKSSYAPELTVYGRLETPRQTALTAALSADVVAVQKLEGELVKANDVVIELDAIDANLVVQQRQADLVEIDALIDVENDTYTRDKALINNEVAMLKLANNAVARSKKLEQSRLASQANLDDASSAMQRQMATVKTIQHSIDQHPARLKQLQARKKRAEALLQQAQRDLSRTLITAPFDGRIAQLNVSVGERVRSGDPLITLYDLSDLEVRAQIPNRYIPVARAILSSGQTVLAKATIEGEDVTLQFSRLSGEVRTDSGGVDAYFSLISNNTPFALGTFVDLTISLAEQKDVIALPYNALYGLSYVYKLVDGRLQHVDVTQVGELTSASGQKQVLVRSDALQDGDKVINTQLPNAISGLKVETSDD